MSATLRAYCEMWRACFAGRETIPDGFQRFVARLTILCLHAALLCLLILAVSLLCLGGTE